MQCRAQACVDTPLTDFHRAVRARYLSYIGSLFGVDFPDRRVAVRSYDHRVRMLMYLRGSCSNNHGAHELPIRFMSQFNFQLSGARLR